MKQTTIDEGIKELTESFSTVQMYQEGSTTYVRVPQVGLPKGCKPSASDVLMRLNSSEARPVVYVCPGITTPAGISPRSTTPVLVLGESWMQFSYQFPWDEEKDSLSAFIGAAMQRFAKNE